MGRMSCCQFVLAFVVFSRTESLQEVSSPDSRIERTLSLWQSLLSHFWMMRCFSKGVSVKTGMTTDVPWTSVCVTRGTAKAKKKEVGDGLAGQTW